MKLHKETVSELLLSSLQKLMEEEAFSQFRLVGGTALALQLGHRVSIDIDLFTDMEYGSMDTNKIANALLKNFNYIEGLQNLQNRELGEERHPYEIDRNNVINKLRHIPHDIDNTPILCLKGKYWEFIVEDIEEAAANITSTQ